MEFQLSYFKSWKMMLWKCCTQYASKFGKLNSSHRTGKGQFSFQSQRKAMPKNVQSILNNCTHLTGEQGNAQKFPSETSTVLEPWNSRCSNCIRKGRRTRDQIANICWIIKKAREFQKNIYFDFIDCAKTFDYVGHNKLESSSRDGNTRPPDLPPEKSGCRSRSNS